MATNEARSTRIQLRLSPTEADQLGKLSARLGVSKTQAVRQAVASLLGEPVAGQPEPVGSGAPGERALDFQLGRIRSNLKQLESVGKVGVKVGDDEISLIEYYETVVPQRVLRACLTDVEREKAAADLRDRIGKPLAVLVLEHNGGVGVTTQQIAKITGLRHLLSEWKTATTAA